MPNIDLSILNQRQTPAFFASSLATRPAFGFAGRIFIDSDVPSTGLYRDTGAAWVQIADPGAGTTGTLQQVTTNGNTTSQGINITAGGLSSNIVTIATNSIGSTANYIGQTYASNDTWKIYGTGTVADQGEMVFEVGDNARPYASGGERYRFSYDNSSSGTAKDVFIVDYDLSYFNTSLGINTPTPSAALDVHSAVSGIAQLNQTVATNNSLLNFQNSGNGLWRIGSFYNAGANDFGIFDVVGSAQPVTVKKTTGQVLIGTSTVGSGKLVVASATGDNGVQIVGATAPSLRIDNAESGPTKRAGLGISTAVNNFIQGSADRDFCMFNSSTTASPILFGIYDAGLTNTQEAARISAARNFLIGTTTDNGQKLQVRGSALIDGNVLSLTGTGLTEFKINNSITEWEMYMPSGSTDLRFYRGTDKVTITSAGNIGINTNSPLQTTANRTVLTLNGTTSNVLNFGVGGVLSNYIYSDANDSGIYAQGNLYLQADGVKFTAFVNNSVEAMRITSSRNLLIGTTTDAGQKLQVNGNALFASNITITNAARPYFIALTTNGNEEAGIKIQQSGNSDWYIGTSQGSASAQDLSIRDVYNARILASFKANGVINFNNVPTSAAGLVSGDIYRTANVLNIVP